MMQPSLSPQPRKLISAGLMVAIALCAVVTTLFWSERALAQTPQSFRIPPFDFPPGDSAAAATRRPNPVPLDPGLIVDTDPGVDDAIALSWLLSNTTNVNVLGFVAVAGNTTVENAAQNIRTVLQKTGKTGIEVVTGAKKPLDVKLSSTGMLIHGKDGLWGQQLASAAAASAKDAREFYCENAVLHPGSTILALGPLTNIATAVEHCGKDMKKYSRIVILGGAKFGGNTTPVSEFNFWQDPEAAQIVLESGMNIEILPLDTFSQLTFSFPDVVERMGTSPNRAFRHLVIPLSVYAQVQLGILTSGDILIPDLAAMIYTVKGFGALESALVEVVEEPELVRGQSIIGFLFSEKVTMIADDKELSKIAEQAFAPGQDFPNPEYVQTEIGKILARVPDNAKIVIAINAEQMRTEFFKLMPLPSSATSAEEIEQHSDRMFLPSINVD